MKNILLFGLCLLLMPLPEANAAPTRYSTDWLPITGPEVQKRVKSLSSHSNATELFRLWQQAWAQKQPWFYAIALRDVVQQQPHNAPAIATYSLVMLTLMRDAGRMKNFARAKQLYFSDDLTPVGIRARIDQAKALDAKQWPIWVAESQIIPFGPGDFDLDKMGATSEAFARRAIALENNSYTNSALAYALCSRSSGLTA